MNLRLSALRRALLLGLTLLALAGCGGHRTTAMPKSKPALPAAPGAPDTAQLPPLGSLVNHQASFTELGLMAEGNKYDSTLAFNRITVQGSDLVFAPSPGGVSPSSMAYAVYDFDASGYNRDLNLRLTWTTAPAVGTAYLALANFTTGHWQWFAVPADNIIPFTNLADFISPAPSKALYAAVLVTSGTGTLDRLRVGTQPSTGLPTAVLTPDRFSVPPGGVVNFDGRRSSANAPATIVSYEFDPGDGTGFIPNAPDNFGFEFDTPGTFSVRLRVTDTFGAQDTASITITVGGVAGYDEIEPNSDQSIAQLIQLPVYGWHGNCGPQQASEAVYDGSDNDEFKFTAKAGDRLQASLLLDPTIADLDLLLLDVNGAHLTTSEGVGGTEQFSYTFADADAGPFCLVVQSYRGSSDYYLYATLNAPQTVLTVSPPGGQAPLHVTLDASASTNPGGTIAGYAFDPDGDGTFLDVQSSPTLTYDYPLAQVYYPSVAVLGGDGVYSYVTKVVYPSSPYSEVENNDEIPFAQPLPAMPFSNFKGNVGFGGVYDHDDSDVFSFTANPGDVVHFSIIPGAGVSELGAQLGKADLSSVAGLLPPETELSYTVQAGDPMPLYLSIYTDGGLTDSRDYTIKGDVNGPTARLISSNGYSSLGPLSTTLDASGSTALPPRTIVGYQFDPEGDGTFLMQQPGATLLHTYSANGLYHPVVRVVDSAGGTADATAGIFIGKAYNEVEDNDTPSRAQALPAFPFVGFEGSNGSGPGYAGYDGDNLDCFRFNANSGQRLQLTLTYPNATGELSMRLTDGLGADATSANGIAGTATINYVLGDGDNGGPYLLLISDPAGAHYGDYSLEGHLYSEAEDNDTLATAQPLPAFPFDKFNGSQGTGPGYPGYDGDQSDFFRLNGGSAGQTLNVNLFYVETGGEMSVDLFDTAGNDVAYHDGAGGVSNLTYVLGSAGNDTGGPYTMQIWDIHGAHYGDYSLGATLN